MRNKIVHDDGYVDLTVVYDTVMHGIPEMYEKLKEIEKINETLVSCKTYFNNNTSELNKLIRKFPTNIIAKIHGYKIKPFFDGKNMQDAVIDDFKL